MLHFIDIDKKLFFWLSEPKIALNFGNLRQESRRDLNFSLK